MLHTPEGVRDIYSNETLKKHALEAKLMSVFHSYGFMDVQTPTFEYMDVFNHGGMIDHKRMYKFFDRDSNILCLRPDITPSIARFIATRYQHDMNTKKVCYLGNVFRNNENYQGKLREFTQAGVEQIGEDGIETDAEIIAMCVNCFLAAGLTEFQIDIGQAGFFNGLIEETGLEDEYKEELSKLIDEKNYIAVEELLESLNLSKKYTKTLLNLPRLFGSVDVIQKARDITSNEKALLALDRLEMVYNILCDYGVEKYVSFDLGMTSQINYYTGVLFKGYTYSTGVSIVDGGRYDNLLDKFGSSKPAVGFAIIIDELMSALERQQIATPTHGIDTLLLYNNLSRKVALSIADEMRVQGMNIISGDLSKDLEGNIQYGKAIQVGGIMNFITDNKVELINLSSDEKRVITVDELLNGGDK
jgi:ATP phosphoribosyltransferase regulatory subunit